MSDVTVTVNEPTVSLDAGTVLVAATPSSPIVTLTDASAIVEVPVSAPIVEVTPQAAIVEASLTSLVIEVQPTGAPGPAGSWDDETMYAEQLDEVTSSLYYKGWATPGTATSAASWRIQKIAFSGNDVVKTWADGSDAFNQVWDDRLTLDYS